MPRSTVYVLVLMLALPTVLALDPLGEQDDASTGSDAPDAAADAVAVSFGAHTGEMDGILDVQDWYGVSTGDQQTMHVEYFATYDQVWFRVLDVAGDQVHEAYSNGNARLCFAGSEGASYRFEFATDSSAVRGADYFFRVFFTSLPQNDAGLGIDVPDCASQPQPIPAGTIEGQLHPPSSDFADWYGINKPWGAWVNITLVPEPGKVATMTIDSITRSTIVQTAAGEPISVSTDNDVFKIGIYVSGSAPAMSYALTHTWWVPGPTPPIDDAGLGIDAPGGWTQLPLLAEGTYEGRVDYVRGDEKDHFAFESPPGFFPEVTFTMLPGSDSARVGVHASGTQQEGDAILFDGDTRTYVGGLGRQTLTLDHWVNDYEWPPATQALYRIELRSVERPDVLLTNLRIEPSSLDPAQRVVRVDLVNPSGLVARPWTSIYVVDSAGSQTILFESFVSIGPHATHALTASWLSAAFVGEVTVGAACEETLDPNPANDRIEQRASGAVDPGLGVGIGWIPDVV